MIDIIKKFFNEKNRMCYTMKNCQECPLFEYDTDCYAIELKHPDKQIEIIQKWSDEHQQKTYLDDFLEKFPDTEIEFKTPFACAMKLYGVDCLENHDCQKCWNRTIKE